MAFTSSLLVKTVFGDKRVQAYRITADAATGSVATGLDYIDFFAVGNQSSTAGTEKYAMNELTSGTACVGTVAITGATSGDEYILTVYGR